jgi:leucyl-tRNA synthetase
MKSFMVKEVEKEYTKNTLIKNYSKILTTIQPIIPHFSSECLKLIKIENLMWPQFDEKIIEEKEVNFVVQINGKKRGIINSNKEILEKDLFDLVKNDTKINKYFENKKIIKTIFVKKKLINLIVKDV